MRILNMKKLALITYVAALVCSVCSADENKFNLEGSILHYNSEADNAEKKRIDYSDIKTLRSYLISHPEITSIHLNSYGGLTEAGIELGRLLSDFKIETVVTEECSSACVSIFLAGETRTLKNGGLLGFHRPEWTVDGMQNYYSKNSEAEGWNSPFAFASWVQKDTLFVAAELLEGYIRAGIDFDFAKRSLQIPFDQMWYPSRDTLLQAGVITNGNLTSF